MLVEIKYCGSSTVMNNKQKHLMATIFSSGCYVPYIYTIIAAPLHFLRLPLSSIFVVLGPSTLSPIAESWSAVARDVDYPSRTMVRVNAWHVRLNACESEIV